MVIGKLDTVFFRELRDRRYAAAELASINSSVSTDSLVTQLLKHRQVARDLQWKYIAVKGTIPMAYPIDSMTQNQTEIDGKWVISRPISGPFWQRFKDAWLVLIGNADAVIFYKQ